MASSCLNWKVSVKMLYLERIRTSPWTRYKHIMTLEIYLFSHMSRLSVTLCVAILFASFVVQLKGVGELFSDLAPQLKIVVTHTKNLNKARESLSKLLKDSKFGMFFVVVCLWKALVQTICIDFHFSAAYQRFY